jgi:enoyl-CoA hydratase/carnithine racemase
MSETLLSRRDGAALVLSINRVSDQNRIDSTVMQAMNLALDAADKDHSIRVIVITGTGEYFCAGGRIDGHPNGTIHQQLGFTQAFCDLQERMGRSRCPIVAAVQGHCTAGGMSLLAASDFGIAADDVQFSYPEIDFGLFPMLAMAVTHHILPPKRAFDFFYSGRRFSAAEALANSLINRAVPRAQFPSAITETIAMLEKKDPLALALGRKAYYAMAQMAPGARLDYAQTMLTTMLSSGSGAVPRTK